MRRRRLTADRVTADGFTAGDFMLRPLAGADAVVATCVGLREDLETSVLSLDVPALFVRGADSTFVTSEAFAATKSLRPDLAFSVVDGADHYVPEEQPGPLAELIEDFLAGAGSPRADSASGRLGAGRPAELSREDEHKWPMALSSLPLWP